MIRARRLVVRMVVARKLPVGLTVTVGQRKRIGAPAGAQGSSGPVSVSTRCRTCWPPGPVAKLMLPALLCPGAALPRADPALTDPL